jgi:hypothetical protein
MAAPDGFMARILIVATAGQAAGGRDQPGVAARAQALGVAVVVSRGDARVAGGVSDERVSG